MDLRHTANRALVGVAGAAALFGVHQLARAVTDDAPRIDLVGMRGIEKVLDAAGVTPPGSASLYWLTFASAIATDSSYYALVGAGRNANRWVRGAMIGAAAGAGALLLPRRLGLGDPPKSDRTANQVMTIAWYVIGGLVAAAAAAALDRRTRAVLAGAAT